MYKTDWRQMSVRTGKNSPINLRKSAEPGKGSVVFTGPDDSRDFRPKFSDFPYYIGESQHVSAESTRNLNYLYRAAPYGSYQLPKQYFVGEIGWGWCLSPKLNKTNLQSGMQFKGEFRQQAQDKLTHRYQNPWRPPPAVLDQKTLGRAFLAWPLKRLRRRGPCIWNKRTAVSPFCEGGAETVCKIQGDSEETQMCEKEAHNPLDLKDQEENILVSNDI